MSDEIKKFKQNIKANIDALGSDNDLLLKSNDWLISVSKHNYSYNFSWLGRPVIQFPQDIVALQELVYEVKPDLIIEMGVAHGGSLIMNASYLAMLDYCDAFKNNNLLNPSEPKRKVLGIDIDIREHNRKEIEAHPMSSRIDLIQGSSIDKEIINQVYNYAKDYSNIIVILDSNHTHDHVLQELEAYAPLTSHGSYCIVFDTIIEDMPEDFFPERPWSKGDNPKTAVWEYMEKLQTEDVLAADGAPLSLKIDKEIESKLQITVAPDGYLKRI